MYPAGKKLGSQNKDIVKGDKSNVRNQKKKILSKISNPLSLSLFYCYF